METMAMVRPAPLRYSDEINGKLIKFMNETGYNIIQINGQRISTSPHIDRKPGRGCEVFVGKIPRDCYEDELFPLFLSVGHVHELRLMMMFSGTTRGYAFVMYECLQDAQRAVQQLDNLEIRRGHRIGVLPCVNNCRLFIGCFEANERSEVHIQQVLRDETECVASVSRRQGRNGRWYVLVEYFNHRAAAIARRELTPRRTQLFGPRVVVDWEIPLDQRGRKMAVDHRRALKTSPMQFKPLEVSASNDVIGNERFLSHFHNGANCKVGKHMLCGNESAAQCHTYHDMWLKSGLNKNEPLFRPRYVMQLNALNQSQVCRSGWYPSEQMISRPRVGLIYPELGSNCSYSQNVNPQSDVYRQIVTRARGSLMRSMDSSHYSDPECQRPFSSESSGSARSSFSLSHYEGNTGPFSLSSSGGWHRSLSNDLTDSSCSEGDGRPLLKDSATFHSLSQLPPWQMENQWASYFSDMNNNKSSIQSSHFQSQEDHELIDNLFTKGERDVNASGNDYEDITMSLRALTTSYSSECPKNWSGWAG